MTSRRGSWPNRRSGSGPHGPGEATSPQARAGLARISGSLLFLLFALLPVGCGVPGPDGPSDTYGIDFTPPTGTEPAGCFVFVVDGLNARLFNELLRAGELPNIQRYFVDRGLYCPAAVASVPSVTLANLTAVAAGTFPGHCDITGINHFDRRTHLWRDYATIAQKNTLDGDHDTPLIFEYFPDEFTVSLFFQPHRGASKFFENWLSAGPAFGLGWYDFVDRLTLFRLGEMMDLARDGNRWPRVVVAYLLWPDFAAYGHGISNDVYRRSIRHADRQIGRVLGDLDRVGALDKLVLALVSDHSHSDVTGHLDLADWLEDRGLAVASDHLAEETSPHNRRDYYERFDCVLTGSGERYAAIYLKRPGAADWSDRPSAEDLQAYPVAPGNTVDLPAGLLEHPAVDVVAFPAGPHAVRVRTRLGSALLTQPGGPGGDITLTVTAGEQPLGYDLPRSVTLSRQDWLERTTRTDYPDAPVQLSAYFRADRSGDLALFATPGWDFGRHHRGGHGGLRAEQDMLVPLILAGPGVPNARLDTARTVDLLPTLLHLLDKPVPSDLDGRSRIEGRPAEVRP
jgi:hypothetical protein